MPTRELIDITLQVLGRHLVVDAMKPRFNSAQKLSRPFVCVWPRTHSPTEWFTASCGLSIPL